MHYCSDSSQLLHQMVVKWILTGKKYTFLPAQNIGREQRQKEWEPAVQQGKVGMGKAFSTPWLTSVQLLITFLALRGLSGMSPTHREY